MGKSLKRSGEKKEEEGMEIPKKRTKRTRTREVSPAVGVSEQRNSESVRELNEIEMHLKVLGGLGREQLKVLDDLRASMPQNMEDYESYIKEIDQLRDRTKKIEKESQLHDTKANDYADKLLGALSDEAVVLTAEPTGSREKLLEYHKYLPKAIELLGDEGREGKLKQQASAFLRRTSGVFKRPTRAIPAGLLAEIEQFDKEVEPILQKKLERQKPSGANENIEKARLELLRAQEEINTPPVKTSEQNTASAGEFVVAPAKPGPKDTLTKVKVEPIPEAQPQPAPEIEATEQPLPAPVPEPVEPQPEPARPEKRKKKRLDLRLPIIKEILSSRDRKEWANAIIGELVWGELEKAKKSPLLKDFFKNLPAVSERKLMAELSVLDWNFDEFQTEWENRLSGLFVEALGEKITAEKKKLEAQALSWKDKISWKSVMKKVGMVAGGAMAAGLLVGGVAAIGAGIAASGVITRLLGRDKKRKENEQRAVQKKVNKKMDENEHKAIEKIYNDLGGDIDFISEVFSQTIREAGATPAERANINGLILYENALSGLKEELEVLGQTEAAQGVGLDILTAGLKKRISLEDAAREAEKDPTVIKIVELIQKTKSGTAALDDERKLINVLAYAAPIAIGAAVALASAATGGAGTSIVRSAMAGLAGGYGGYKLGKALDTRKQKKNIKEELQKIVGKVRGDLRKFSENELDITQVDQERIEKLEGHLRIGSLDSEPILKTQAEALLREAHHILFEKPKLSADAAGELDPEQQKTELNELAVKLQEHHEAAEAQAKKDIDRVFKKTSRWRRWVGAVGGTVAGVLGVQLTDAARGKGFFESHAPKNGGVKVVDENQLNGKTVEDAKIAEHKIETKAAQTFDDQVLKNLGGKQGVDGKIVFHLGKNGAPANSSEFYRVLALYGMKDELMADHQLSTIDEARVLNVGRNIMELADGGKKIGGISHAELDKYFSVKGNTVTIKDWDGFKQNILDKYSARSAEKITDTTVVGARHGRVSAASYAGRPGKSGWQDSLRKAGYTDKAKIAAEKMTVPEDIKVTDPDADASAKTPELPKAAERVFEWKANVFGREVNLKLTNSERGIVHDAMRNLQRIADDKFNDMTGERLVPLRGKTGADSWANAFKQMDESIDKLGTTRDPAALENLRNISKLTATDLMHGRLKPAVAVEEVVKPVASDLNTAEKKLVDALYHQLKTDGRLQNWTRKFSAAQLREFAADQVKGHPGKSVDELMQGRMLRDVWARSHHLDQSGQVENEITETQAKAMEKLVSPAKPVHIKASKDGVHQITVRNGKGQVNQFKINRDLQPKSGSAKGLIRLGKGDNAMEGRLLKKNINGEIRDVFEMKGFKTKGEKVAPLDLFINEQGRIIPPKSLETAAN